MLVDIAVGIVIVVVIAVIVVVANMQLLMTTGLKSVKAGFIAISLLLPKPLLLLLMGLGIISANFSATPLLPQPSLLKPLLPALHLRCEPGHSVLPSAAGRRELGHTSQAGLPAGTSPLPCRAKPKRIA